MYWANSRIKRNKKREIVESTTISLFCDLTTLGVPTTKNSSMNEEILCEARERKRSLLGVNEHFVIRSIVQNLPIRTNF